MVTCLEGKSTWRHPASNAIPLLQSWSNRNLKLSHCAFLQMSPVKIDGAKRQLFSLAKEQNVKLLEAAQKKKKGRSPPTETADAAEPAETDAAEAGKEPAKEAEQVAEGQKTKRLQVKREKSAPADADGGSVGQSIKRKRKDDSESKVRLICCKSDFTQDLFCRDAVSKEVV